MAVDSYILGFLFFPVIRIVGYGHSRHPATAYTAKRYKQALFYPALDA